MNGDIGDGRTGGRRLRRSIEGRNRRETEEGREKDRRAEMVDTRRSDLAATNECYVVVLIGGVLDRKTTEGCSGGDESVSDICSAEQRS